MIALGPRLQYKISGILNRTRRFSIILLMLAVGYDPKQVHMHINTTCVVRLSASNEHSPSKIWINFPCG
jgi:hypothetical protein